VTACDICGDSPVRGVAFPWHADEGIAGVERCDTCGSLEGLHSDADAAVALNRSLPCGFAVVPIAQCSTEDCNCEGNCASDCNCGMPIRMRYAVHCTATGDLLTFEEGIVLAKQMLAQFVTALREPTKGAP